MKTYFTVDNLSLKNFKGVKDLKADFNNASVLLLGSEGVGKTNVWLALQMLLGDIPTAVVNKDEEQGETVINISKDDTKYRFVFNLQNNSRPKLTTYVNEKKITQANQAYIIEKLKPQQVDIDKLINTTGQAQVELIKQSLGIDTTQLEEDLSDAIIERRALNQEVNNFILNRCDKIDKPTTNISVLQSNRAEISNLNKKKEQSYQKEFEAYQHSVANNNKIDVAADKLKDYKEEKQELLKKLKELQETINYGEKWLKDNPKVDEEMPVPPKYDDYSEIDAKIRNVEKQEYDYKAYLAFKDREKDYQRKQKQADEKDSEVKALRQEILSKINDSDNSIEGLSIETEISEAGRMKSRLLYDGLPFDDDSINTAKKYAIGAKLQMNMFKDNQLAVMHFNGSMMSENTIRNIITECNNLGIQALVEITSRKDNEELVIESYEL